MGMMTEDDFIAAIQTIDRRERHRKQYGPICARCNHSPLDDADLPPSLMDLSPDATTDASTLMVRTFFCDQVRRHETADGGRGCHLFDARISAWIG